MPNVTSESLEKNGKMLHSSTPAAAAAAAAPAAVQLIISKTHPYALPLASAGVGGLETLFCLLRLLLLVAANAINQQAHIFFETQPKRQNTT